MINKKELINILDKQHIDLYRENIRSMLDDAIVICCRSSDSETLNNYFNLVRKFHFDILNKISPYDKKCKINNEDND